MRPRAPDPIDPRPRPPRPVQGLSLPLGARLVVPLFLITGLLGSTTNAVLFAKDRSEAARRSDELLKLWSEGRRAAMTEALPGARASTARSEVQELRRLRILALLPLGEGLAGTGRADLRALESEVAVVASEVDAFEVPFLRRVQGAAPLLLRPWLRRLLLAGRQAAERPDPSLYRYVALMSTDDVDVRRRATAAMAERLAGIRRTVLEGGELSLAEQRLVTSPALINTLIDQLEREPDRPTLDQLTPLAVAEDTGNARALHALALVETPAREALEGARRARRARAGLALAAIDEAVKARLRRRPGSTWSSAAGELPVAGIIRGFCGHCKLSLPVGAIHCSNCGRSIAETSDQSGSCPRCRISLGADGTCPRCGGAAAAAPRRLIPCRRCEQGLTTSALFCTFCGAPQRRVSGGRPTGGKGVEDSGKTAPSDRPAGPAVPADPKRAKAPGRSRPQTRSTAPRKDP